MQKLISRVFFSFLLCCVAGVGWGLPLNQADIPVESRSSESFNQALTHAYMQVLIKQSGNPSIMTIPQVKNSLTAIKQNVESYSYRRASGKTEQADLVLHVVFDAVAIKKLLEKAGQTVWEGGRKPVLVLLSLQTEAGRQVVSNLNDPTLSVVLQQAAEGRGLQLIFPVMDLEDQTALTSQLSESYTAFKQRYQVRDILFGEMNRDDSNNYTINWTLMLGDSPYYWSTLNTEKEAAIKAGMDSLLETLASRYASMRSERLLAIVKLEVKGISGLSDYVKVLTAVRHLHDVAAVSVKEMNPESLVLSVKVTGGVDALSRELSQSTEFKPEQAVSMNGVDSVDLIYRWSQGQLQSAQVDLEKLPPFLESASVDQVAVQPYHANQQVRRVSS